MPFFFYKAKTIEGETESGAMEAKDEQVLARSLRKEGKFLVWSGTEKKRSKKNPLSFFKKISMLEKIMFTRNLGVMISAGVSLPKALDVLTAQAQLAKFKKIIQKIKEDVVKEESLSSSLKKHPVVFPSLFSNMILAGEESGSLVESLNVLTEQMEKQHDLKSKIKSALMYPIVIIVAMIGIGILMMVMVVPMIAETFEQLEVELPLATRGVMASGVLIANYWFLFLFFLLIFAFLMRFLLKREKGKIIKDKLFLKIPVVSNLIKKKNLAYICRTLGSLISSGVSLIKSLQLVSLSINNFFYKKAIEEAIEEVQKGTKLAESLEKHEYLFSSLVVQMIQVGEETGETASLLNKLAEFYEQETVNITKNLSTLIEPILMLIIGAAVGFFAISIIQPIYSMLETM